MRIDYLEYLKTPEWAATRARALDYAGLRCQLCNSKERIEVHHNCYNNLGTELHRDLIVLCHRCHGTFHSQLGKNSKRRRLSEIMFGPSSGPCPGNKHGADLWNKREGLKNERVLTVDPEKRGRINRGIEVLTKQLRAEVTDRRPARRGPPKHHADKDGD